MRRSHSVAVLTCVVVLASLCTSGCATQAARKEHDPIEPVNRAIFRFNDTLDTYILVPTAKGWKVITPNIARLGIARFFDNLTVPLNAMNNLLQGKPKRAMSDVARFVINTTIGLGGFADPATGLGAPKHDEDFGQTLGFWGVPPGPYLVLPLFGSSNLRDVFGRLAPGLLSIIGLFIDAYILIPINALDVINTRALYLDEVDAAKAAALDYYVFTRDAYRQRREALIRDARESGDVADDDLYYLDAHPPAATEDLYYPDGDEPAGGTPNVAPDQDHAP